MQYCTLIFENLLFYAHKIFQHLHFKNIKYWDKSDTNIYLENADDSGKETLLLDLLRLDVCFRWNILEIKSRHVIVSKSFCYPRAWTVGSRSSLLTYTVGFSADDLRVILPRISMYLCLSWLIHTVHKRIKDKITIQLRFAVSEPVFNTFS